jgi:ABC-type transporter lipoprotein component MlaA
VRDLVGNGVDIAISPTTYLLGPIVFLYYGGGMGIVKREENYQALNALEDSSIDFYSTLRSAYQQQRSEDVWGRRRHRLEDAGEAATEVPR